MANGHYIEAREYDYIVAHRAQRGSCRVVPDADFKALREFVLRNLEGNGATELMRLCSPPGIGEALQLQNYVGVLELQSGLQIEVLPKIDVGEERRVREVFLRMLAELGPDTSFKSMSGAHVSSGDMPLFEVFVTMFLDECSTLVRRGLRSAYSEVRSREPVVRGKIDFARQVRENPAHAEILNLVHQEYNLDRPENRIVKTTLRLLRSRSRSADNVRRAAQLLDALDGVSYSLNVDADFSRCVTDRTTRGYETLLGWCRVFLRGESFSMFRGGSVAMALLFPMERVFEEYVGKTLRKTALSGGVLRSVELQARGKWLFDGHRVPLRPDILCVSNGGCHVVLDTKWKRVSGPRDLTVSDMHQMYAYGRRYRGKDEVQHVILLYPWHDEVKRRGLLRSGRHVSPDGVQVDMFFVDLGNMDKSVSDLIALLADPSVLEG